MDHFSICACHSSARAIYKYAIYGKEKIRRKDIASAAGVLSEFVTAKTGIRH